MQALLLFSRAYPGQAPSIMRRPKRFRRPTSPPEEIIPPTSDQFDIAEAAEAVKRKMAATVIERSIETRRRKLRRAPGRCDYRDAADFLTAGENIHFETHRPNAHFGAQRNALRTRLRAPLAEKG